MAGQGVYEHRARGEEQKAYYLAEVELKLNRQAYGCISETHLTRRFTDLGKAKLWALERSGKPDATGMSDIYLINPGGKRERITINPEGNI